MPKRLGVAPDCVAAGVLDLLPNVVLEPVEAAPKRLPVEVGCDDICPNIPVDCVVPEEPAALDAGCPIEKMVLLG